MPEKPAPAPDPAPDPDLDAPTRPPGRPRSVRADRAILEAALDAFTEDGYEGMSMEGVASRAGVGKSTVYRRWPCKDDLLLAAIESLLEDFHVDDTGDVRADLTAVARQALRFITETKAGEVLPRMVVQVVTGTPLGRAYAEKIMGPRAVAAGRVIEAAKARGELHPDLDAHLAVASLVGSLIFLRITSALPDSGDGPAAVDLAERLVGQLLDGMAAATRSHPAATAAAAESRRPPRSSRR